MSAILVAIFLLAQPGAADGRGIDHEKLTYRHAGRDFRLTDVHGDVVRDILA